MKKFRVILVLILLSISFYLTINYSSISKEIIISKTLNSEAYSYLGDEAREFVKDSYLETGEFVLTEKNKEENTPYLNPKYLEYLELSDEEKKDVSVVPSVYTVEYKMKEYKDVDLPSSYTLNDVDGKKFVTKQQHQGQLNLCWSFAALEQVESLLLVKNNTSYSDSSTIFSKRHLDYASSTDGIKDYNNTLGSRNLLDGGNYLAAAGPLSVGVGFVDYNYMGYPTTSEKKELSEILNYNNSLYELNEAVVMPTLDATATDEEKTSYNNYVKKIIMENGGAFIGSEAPGSCGSYNSDDTYFVRVDDNCSHDSPHAMQIIGWDDNYSYSYCKGEEKHSPISDTCSANNIVSGTGAWLVRNSWGDSYANFYITYDSEEVEIYSTTDVSSMNDRSWDNVYPYSTSLMSFYISNRASSTFERKTTNKEKIEKIKFFTILEGGIYKLSINTGSKTYNNIKQINLEYPGLYTIDLSEDNIYLEDDTFTVALTTTYGSIIKDGISVFTSNVSDTPLIFSDTKSLEYDSIQNNVSFRLYTNTRNINSNSLVNYKLKKSSNGEDLSNYLTVSNNIVAKNDINPLLTIKKGIPNGSYNIEITNQNALLSIPLTIGDESNTLSVNYHSNDSNNTSTKQSVNSGENFNLINNPFTRVGYIFNKWNTSSNGDGKDYTNGQYTSITEDLDLYAQWSPIKYYFRFNSNGGTGYMSNQTFTYDTRDNLLKNTFTRVGYLFKKWNTLSNGSGLSYNDEEPVLNATSRNNEVIDLFAQYDPITYKIRFNSNGGTGNMSDQTFTYDVSTKLNRNTFTRAGYTFSSWNTKADGSGNSYSNSHDILNLSSTLDDIINLYAIWEEKEEVVEYEIDDYQVDEDKLFIDLISINTTKNNFLSQFTIGNDFRIDIDLGDKTYIFTGSKTKIFKNNTLYREYTNIVRGDINGDGKITALDYVKVKNHIMGNNIIKDDVHKLSADITQDNKITALDYVRIKNYIMNGGN